MLDPVWSGLQLVIAQRLGLNLSRRSPLALQEIFSDFLKQTGFTDLNALKALLQQEPTDGPHWQLLVQALTVAETYFFRDIGQLEVISQAILPSLLSETSGPLRIWSAGCSTGEEAYTLAMMLDEQRARPSTAVEVVGTDLNPEVVAHARAGVYRERALRNVTAEQRERYFVRHPRGWQVDPRMRDRVSFWCDNLVEPDVKRQTVDLIVCRNVLIYFTPDQILTVLKRFREALRPGGYLLTGHGELHGADTSDWEVSSHQGSLVYRRPTGIPLVSAPVAVEPSAVQPDSPSARARRLPVEPTLDPDRDWERFVSDCLKRGAYPRGREVCQRRSRLHPFEVRPRVWEARLARAQGRLDEARRLAQQAIYLDPESGSAFLEMALVSADGGDLERAGRFRSTALELLRSRSERDCSGPLAELSEHFPKES